jgi:serine protease Do
MAFAGMLAACACARAEAVPDALQPSVEAAVARVNPALVQIHVVRTYYEEGRELKYEAMGSGAVITPDGHVITNHHVAGHSTRLMCTFPDK